MSAPDLTGWKWVHNETHGIEELTCPGPCPRCRRQYAKCQRCGGSGIVTQILAWVQPRPAYCDRGHYLVNVQCVPDLDQQDGFPRYYMDLAAAMRETELFLAWRLHKQRGAPPHDRPG